MQCEAVLLGREAVGAVDAPAVATLIRTLLQARERVARAAGELYRDRRRYILRCGDGLEIAPCPRPPPASATSTASTATPTHSASPAPSSTSSGSSTRPRRADDEGFESDDDTASTKSAASLDDTVSNSSSCCFVDDHVFKFGSSAAAARGVAISTSSNSSVATDSANSSGASDTDDVDSSGAPSPGSGQVSKLVKSLTLYQRAVTAPPAPQTADTPPPTRPEGEVYPMSDIAFCHLDPAFPKVVVWVVKRKRPQRLSATPEGNNTGLQAIVFECTNERALKKFCANFQEMSRRAKLDQYKHPHRRKDIAPAFATLYRGYLPSMRESPREKPTPEMQIQAVENPKVVKLELEVAKGSDTKTINGTRILKSPPKTLPKPPPPPVIKEEELPVAAKFNLVQRTDGDGVTHIEVARGSPDAASPTAPRIETLPETASGPSSIISISTPDVGNLLTTASGLQRTSRLGKEIEGVIRSDMDASSRREPQRQRQPAILVLNGDAVEELHKVWTPPEAAAALAAVEDDDEDQKDVVVADPPQRPERRKYVRKKNPAPQPPIPQLQSQPPPPRATPSPDPFLKKPLVPYKPESLSRGQKIVRGQFIRVSVDQTSVPVQQPWIFGSSYASGGWGGTDPIREHIPRRGLDDMFAIQGHSLRQHPHNGLHRRSRSTGGAGRSRSKSPPMTRRPMAYRYIDVANPPPPQPQPPTAGRFFGLSQKLKELSGGGQSQHVHPGYATTARRRGSVGEASHLAAAAQGCHLKSVIKKSKRAGEYVEPKKVTFSAYATVQVVD